MEAEVVLDIYKRAVENYNIQYNPFIADGDSSTYSTVDKERPFGAIVFAQTKEYNEKNGY